MKKVKQENSFIPDKPFFKQDISEETLTILDDLMEQYVTDENIE